MAILKSKNSVTEDAIKKMAKEETLSISSKQLKPNKSGPPELRREFPAKKKDKEKLKKHKLAHANSIQP